MTSEDVLLSDQVFQLNIFLWALQELPKKSQIQPVLRQAGYDLNSIGRKVVMPVDANSVDALQRLIGSNDRSPCHPDLWIQHKSDSVMLLVELKGRGFSPDSSNRRQALKLIAASSNLASTLGQSDERPGHVLYATIYPDASGLEATLKELALKVEAEGIVAAPTGVISLSMEVEGVGLTSPVPSDLPQPAAKALSKPAIVLFNDGENDITPLYFIPWIPGIKDSQDPDRHSAGLRELTARLLTETLAEVGKAQTPTALSLDAAVLLSRATFGVFRHWQDTDKKQFIEAAAKQIERALKPAVILRREAGGRLEVDLPNKETQELAINRLEQADPADPKANLQAAVEEPPTLFD